jgi:hypothetical protein
MTWDFCIDTNVKSVCPEMVHGTKGFVRRLADAERHMCCAVRELVRVVKPGGMVGVFGIMGEVCRFHKSSWAGPTGSYLEDSFWSRCLPSVKHLRKITYYGGKYCPEYYSMIITK